MRGEIIENNMNLPCPSGLLYQLTEEGNELGTGMALRGFPFHFAGLDIQGRIERKRSVAIVLETMALGAARRQWQDGIEPVQCLNRGLLVNTEDGRMLRRLHVQPDDVCGLGLKLRVIAGHVAV